MLRKGTKDTEKSESIRTQRAGEPRPRGLVAAPWGGPLSLRVLEDPFSFVEEFDRQFEEMRRNMELLMFPSGSMFTGATGLRPDAVAARVDLRDTGKEFVVTAELPGFSKEEVDLEVTDEGVTLSASRQQSSEEGSEETGYLARERSYSSMRRTVAFPEEVDAEGAHAALKDGVLTLTVPKKHPAEDRKPHKVKIA